MLTVYSAHGSPGASTTALYLAAHWASTGQEVLLLEADPAGGSLSHHLGIQFTPGSASFVASGLPVAGVNLIDHSQDVLFNNLHVMPSTSSPAGARGIVAWFAQHAGELRDVSEREMAVIIDGGRITADSAVADLAAHAAGVVVVARGDSAPTSLEHIGSLLSEEAGGEGTERCAVTIGDSPLSAEEWREKSDVTFCGSIREFSAMTGDLSAFLNRNKRKSKRWRVSLEEVAEQLLPFAKPPESGVVRAPRSAPVAAEAAAAPPPPAVPSEAPGVHAHDSGGDGHDAEAVAAVAPGAGQAQSPPLPVTPPPVAEQPPQFEVQPPVSPPGYVEAQQPQPAHGEGAPPVHTPEPAYYEAPPAAPEPVYTSHPEMPVPVYQPPPVAEPPPQYEQPPAPPPAYHEPSPAPSGHGPPGAAPPAYDQPPPATPPAYGQPPPAAPPVYGQPPPAAPDRPHAAVPSPGYHEPPPAPPAHGQPPAPPATPGYPVPQQQEVDHRHPATQEPTAPQQPPAPPPYPHPAAAEPPVAPSEIAPSGSFRDWAARLHGQVPQGTAGTGGGDVS